MPPMPKDPPKDEEPDVDPPGQRTGEGADSILPHLKRQTQTQVQVPPKPEPEEEHAP
jgi:hypothetical protein